MMRTALLLAAVAALARANVMLSAERRALPADAVARLIEGEGKLAVSTTTDGPTIDDPLDTKLSPAAAIETPLSALDTTAAAAASAVANFGATLPEGVTEAEPPTAVMEYETIEYCDLNDAGKARLAETSKHNTVQLTGLDASLISSVTVVPVRTRHVSHHEPIECTRNVTQRNTTRCPAALCNWQLKHPSCLQPVAGLLFLAHTFSLSSPTTRGIGDTSSP